MKANVEIAETNGNGHSRIPAATKAVKAKAKKEPEKKVVQLKKLDIQRVVIRIRGTTELLVNSMSAKAKNQMREKHAGRAVKREVRNPKADYESAKYLDVKGRECVLGIGIKLMMIEAVTQFKGTLKKNLMMGAFHVDASLLPILDEHGKPAKSYMREDVVKVGPFGNRAADLRYRPAYAPGWQVDIPLKFNANSVTVDILVELLNIAGFSVGYGDWRIAKKGEHGMFEVVLDSTK